MSYCTASVIYTSSSSHSWVWKAYSTILILNSLARIHKYNTLLTERVCMSGDTHREYHLHYFYRSKRLQVITKSSSQIAGIKNTVNPHIHMRAWHLTMFRGPMDVHSQEKGLPYILIMSVLLHTTPCHVSPHGSPPAATQPGRTGLPSATYKLLIAATGSTE